MSDTEAAAMLEELQKYFKEPVMPVSRYCDALQTWGQAIVDRDGYEAELPAAINGVFLAIRKSNLLARLIYGGEELRTRKCPEHEGRWSGIGICRHGCGETGWLPNGFPENADPCDRDGCTGPAVAHITSIAPGEPRHEALCFEHYSERWPY
jgi:hypothetical protein